MRYRYYPTLCTFTTVKDHQMCFKSNKLSGDGISLFVTLLKEQFLRIIKDTSITSKALFFIALCKDHVMVPRRMISRTKQKS